MKFRCLEKGVLYEMVMAQVGHSEPQRLGLLSGDEESRGRDPERKSPAIEILD